MSLTAERLRELVLYDSITGEFAWRIKRSGVQSGGAVGHINGQGYRSIRVDGSKHAAHRLAWLYVYGTWPTAQIDHINGNRADNRIENLRDVSHSFNQQNQRRAQASNRSSGLLGVSLSKRTQRWQAKITLSNASINLGQFETAEAAHAAYVEAKRKLHPGSTL